MRNRKRKKPVKPFRCKNHGPWKFEKTDTGTKRTCTTCGFDVTEVPRVIIILPLTDKRSIQRRQYQEKKARERV
jgi:hypothetical protein